MTRLLAYLLFALTLAAVIGPLAIDQGNAIADKSNSYLEEY